MKRYLLSIDVGTSMVKAILFCMDGAIAARGDRPCHLSNPKPDHYEMDLDAFYQALVETIRECLGKSGAKPEEIAAIGISAYMTGVILLDQEGKQVGENIVWIDSRTTPLLKAWEESGLAEQSYRLTGTALLPGSTLPILCWWKQNRPQVLDRAKYHLFMKDWIRFRLTGEICTDPSEATCLPSSTYERGWSEEVMALYGMKEYMHLLPPIRQPEEIVGAVHHQAALETGLKEGTPVICGLGDMLAGMLGAGALEGGQGVTILGSTLLNSVIQDWPNAAPEGIGMTLATAGGKWARFVNNTGGGTMNSSWAMGLLAQREQGDFAAKSQYYAWLDRQIAAIAPCAEGLMYHPYINSTGVTAPFYNVGARAQFTGIGLHHTRGHLLRAVYEGMAMAIRDCYGAVPGGVGQIRISGGGSRSPVLCQIISDICKKELLLPREAEATALGCAILAACAVGEYASLEEAVGQMVGIEKRYQPDDTLSDRYDHWFDLFQKTAQTMMPLWDQRLDFMRKMNR